MPSFDIISKVDVQSLDNAINVAKKEIANRYDFHGSNSTLELDKKEMLIRITTEHEMRIEAMEDIIRSRMIKQKIDPKCLDFGKEKYASGNMIKKDIRIKQGIDKETAKKIVKDVKDTKLKVQAQIMDEQVRVTGKKIDELQAVIAMCRTKDYGIPLQYENFK
ncbi:MAG TPA: YajQ family cyclic di-GMP-binding protein [Bacteroidia bacterium]|jgi:uncharacterized protein YajQ (UPF0234 family)